MVGLCQSQNPTPLTRSQPGIGHVAQFWPVRPKEGFAEGLLGKVFLLLNGDIQRNMPLSPWDVVASGCVP